MTPDKKYALAVQTCESGNVDEAERLFRQVLAVKPDHVDALVQLGRLLFDQNRLPESIACYRRLRAHLPAHPDVLNNLANVLHSSGNSNEAVELYRRAIAIDPNLAAAHFHLALALLMDGDLADGFAEYEYRTQSKPAGQKRWAGQPLNGETVVLYAEQGFGDMLMFSRFVPMVVARGADVILIAPPSLRRLFATFEGVKIWTETDRLPGRFFECPLVSLPYAFGTTLETVPNAAPYLRADPTPWRDVLGVLSGLKVGLCWAGKPEAGTIDKRRSMRLATLAPILSVPGCSFVSLQLGLASAEITPNLLDVSARLGDWADTAGLIVGLDLVITVDTAVAHLAGALGKPVWMLNRFDTDWRWLLDRSDSPWYPTIRLFRQPAPGDWKTPIEQIVAAIQSGR